MTQLTSLDTWANKVSHTDLESLAKLDELEYLSIGNSGGQESLTAEGLLPRLANIPFLKRVWLDGISIDESDRELLENNYEQVRIT